MTIRLKHGDDWMSKSMVNAQVFAKMEKGMRIGITGLVQRVWEPNERNTVIRLETTTGLTVDALCGGVLVRNQVYAPGTKLMVTGIVTTLDALGMRVGLLLEGIKA